MYMFNWNRKLWIRFCISTKTVGYTIPLPIQVDDVVDIDGIDESGALPVLVQSTSAPSAKILQRRRLFIDCCHCQIFPADGRKERNVVPVYKRHGGGSLTD